MPVELSTSRVLADPAIGSDDGVSSIEPPALPSSDAAVAAVADPPAAGSAAVATQPLDDAGVDWDPSGAALDAVGIDDAAPSSFFPVAIAAAALYGIALGFGLHWLEANGYYFSMKLMPLLSCIAVMSGVQHLCKAMGWRSAFSHIVLAAAAGLLVVPAQYTFAMFVELGGMNGDWQAAGLFDLIGYIDWRLDVDEVVRHGEATCDRTTNFILFLYALGLNAICAPSSMPYALRQAAARQ